MAIEWELQLAMVALAYVMDVSALDFKRLVKKHQEITKFIWLR